MQCIRFGLLVFAVLAGGPALAQDDTFASIGGDTFRAGQTVVHDSAGTDDLFIAGQRVRIEAPVGGSVFAAGQSIALDAAAGGDVQAIGQDLTFEGDIGGDLSAAGQDVRVAGRVGGDLRAAGSVVEIGAPVGGYAVVAAEELRLEAPVAGDMAVGVQRIVFGDAARIAGTLTLYEEEAGRIDVPDAVVPADRVIRRKIEEWQPDEIGRGFVPSWWQVTTRFIAGVAAIAVLAAVIAALVPERLAKMRRSVLAAPFRTLGRGFVAQSAVVGSTVVVGVTLIGLILVPGILVLAVLTALAGYVVGAYAFGVGLLILVGRDEPQDLRDRAVAAGGGALVAGLFGLVPFVGWLFVVALSLTGIGAIVGEVLARSPGPAAAAGPAA